MRCRRCDHRRLVHQHHHAHTYCSQCPCPAYAPWWRFRMREAPGHPPPGGHRSALGEGPRATPVTLVDVEPPADVDPSAGIDHGEPQPDGV